MKKRLMKNAVATLALAAMLTQNMYSAVAVMAADFSDTPDEYVEETVEDVYEEETVSEQPEITIEPEYYEEESSGDLDDADEAEYEAAAIDEEEPEELNPNIEVLDSQISGSGVESIDVNIDTEGLNKKDTFKIIFTGPDSASYDANVNNELDFAAGGTYTFSGLNNEGFNIRVTSKCNIEIEYIDGSVPTIKLTSLDEDIEKFLETKVLTSSEGSPISAIYGGGYDTVTITLDTTDLTEDAKYTLFVETKAEATVDGEVAETGIKGFTKDDEEIVIEDLDGETFTIYAVSENDVDISVLPSIDSVEEGKATLAVSTQEIRVKKKYVYSDANVEVTATLEYAEAVPDDAEFVVTPITEGPAYEAYMAALQAKTDDEVEYTKENTLVYDIAFLVDKKDEDGNVIEGEKVEFEPEVGSVKIEIKFKKSQLSDELGANDNEAVIINHIPLSDEVKEKVDKAIDAVDITIDDVTVEEVVAEADVEGNTDSVEFSIDSLSTVTVTVTNNKLDVAPNAANTYTYIDILGGAVNYGIVANKISHSGHMDTNFAAGELAGNAQITGGKYTGNKNPGNIIIGEYTGSGGFWTDCSQPFIIYTTEAAKNKFNLSNMKNNCPNMVIDTSISGATLKSNVSDLVSGTKSADLKDVDSYIGWVDKVYGDDQKYHLDITDTNKYGAGTYYFTFNSGEFGSKAFSQADKMKIAIREDQNIVFNIPDTSVTIPKFSLKITDENGNGGTETGSDKSDAGADPYTKAIIFNCYNATYVKLDGMFGVVLAPSADAEIGTTSTGWLVCNHMIRNAGEWHGTWQEMPSSFPDSAQFYIKKKLEGNNKTKQPFTFELYITKKNYRTDSPNVPINNWKACRKIGTLTMEEDDYDDLTYTGVKAFDKIVYDDAYINTYKGYADVSGNTYTFYYVFKEIQADGWKVYPVKGYEYVKVTVSRTTVNNTTKFSVDSIVTADDYTDDTGLINPVTQTTTAPVFSFTNIKKGLEKPGTYPFTATKTFKHGNWPAGKTFTLRLVSMDHNDEETDHYGNFVSNYYPETGYNGYGPLPNEQWVKDTPGLTPVYDANNKYCGVDCVVSAENPTAYFGTVDLPYQTPANERDFACDPSVVAGVRCRCYLYKVYELNDSNKDIIPPRYVTNGTAVTNKGVTYDATLQRVKLWVNQQAPNDEDSKITVTVNGSKGGTECEGNLQHIGFINDYSAIGHAGLTVVKNLEGRDPVDGEFTVELHKNSYKKNGVSISKETMPWPAGYNKNTGVTNTGSSFLFGEFEFTEEGEYVYRLDEVDKKDTATSKIEYSNQHIYVKYTITDNHAGTLDVVGPVYYDSHDDLANNKPSANQANAKFNNKFNPEEPVSFAIQKYYDNTAVSSSNPGEFNFRIYSPAGDHYDRKYSENSGSTKKDGAYNYVVNFTGRNYGVGDLGANKAAKDYYYIIEETGTYAGVVKDSQKYRVTVNVSLNGKVFSAKKTKVEKSVGGDDNGTEGWTAVAAGDSALTYVPRFDNWKEGNDSLSVHKIFEKDPSRIFTFTFTDPDGNTQDVNTVNGVATYATKNYTLKDVGSTFTYTVQEKLPVAKNADGVDDKGNNKYKYQGVIYDCNTYTIVVEPYKKDDGTVGFRQHKDTASGDVITQLDVTNEYEVTETSAHLEANKKYNDRALTAADGTFYFSVREVEKDADGKATGNKTFIAAKAAVPNTDGSNNIVFDDMVYTAAGAHEYEIYESSDLNGTPVAASSDDVNYDTTVFTAVIDVQDVNGALVATAPTYALGGTGLDTGKVPTFNNSDKVGATINVQKYLKASDGTTLEVRDGMRQLIEKEFTFELYEAELKDGKYVTKGSVLDTQQNDGQGQLSFTLPNYSVSELTRDADGNYEPLVKDYIVKETTEMAHTTPDYVEQHVRVTVTYTGQMDATVTYYNPTTNEPDATLNKVVFNNKWEAEAYAPLSGTKVFIGSKITEGQFKVGVYTEEPTDIRLADTENPLTPIYEAPVVPQGGLFNKDRDEGKFEVTEDIIKSEKLEALHFTEKDAGRTATVWLREIKGTDDTIDYAKNIVQVDIAIAYNSNDKTITATPTYKTTTNSAVFTNTDKSKVDVSLQASKILVDRNYNNMSLALNGRTYKFYLLDASRNVIKLKNNKNYKENVDGVVSFTNADTAELEYDVDKLDGEASKTFTYYLAEEGYENAAVDENGHVRNVFCVEVDVKINETTGKVEKDTPKYYNVKKEGEGWVKDGAALSDAAVVFKNPYEANGDLKINVKKTLLGRDVKAGDVFTFEVWDLNGENDENDSRVKTFEIAAKEENGKVVLPELKDYVIDTYTERDLGNDGTAVKYYKIKEAAVDSSTGITSGGEIYIIEATLTDNHQSGTINVAKDSRNIAKESEPQTIASKIKDFFKDLVEKFTGATYEFTNTYSAEAKIKFSATKILETINEKVDARTFKFELVEVNGNTETRIGDLVEIARNTDGTWPVEDFDIITYTNESEGLKNGKTKSEHTYIIREIDEEQANDVIHYDDNEYTIHVTVKDGGNGQLTVEAHYDDKNGKQSGVALTPTLGTVAQTIAVENAIENSEDNAEEPAVTETTEEQSVYTFDKTFTFTNTYDSYDSTQFSGTKTCENFAGTAVGTYEITITCVDGDGDAVAKFKDSSFADRVTGTDTTTGKDIDIKIDGNVLKMDIAGNADYVVPAFYYTKDDIGSYTYTVEETLKGQTDNNIKYSTASYEVTVDVAYDVSETGRGEVKVTASDNRTALNFTNTLIREGGLSIPATKKYNGSTAGVKGTYKFALEEIKADGTSAGKPVITATATDSSVIAFDTSSYKFTNDDIGKSYYFKAYETDAAGNEISAANNNIVNEGTTYDTTQYFVKVSISEGATVTNGKGDLAVDYKYYKSITDMTNGTNEVQPAENENAVVFNNTYETKGSIDLTGVKKMNDSGIKLSEAGNIIIELYENSYVNATPISRATVKATGDYTGTFKFSGKDEDKNSTDASIKYVDKLAYGADDLKEDGTAQKTYYMKELTPTGTDKNGGITYDTAVYKIVVDLTDAAHDGVIATTKTITCVSGSNNNDKFANADKVEADKTYEEPLLFKNYYDANGFWDPAGIKVLTGSRGLGEGEFTFTITEKITPDARKHRIFTKYSDSVTNGTPDETTGVAIAQFSHNDTDFLNYKLGEDGEYTYEITESGEYSGVTNSTAKWTVTIDVTDDKNGNMVVTVKKIESTGATDAERSYLVYDSSRSVASTDRVFAFINNFNAEGYINLIGSKSMKGRPLGAGEQYKFWIEEGDKKGYVISNGSVIDFDHNLATLNGLLTYTEEGPHKYKIYEDKDDPAFSKPGVTPDDTYFEVEVEVEPVLDKNTNRPTAELATRITSVKRYFSEESEAGEKQYSYTNESTKLKLLENNNYTFEDVFFFNNTYEARVKIELEGLKHVKYAEEGPDVTTASMLKDKYTFYLYKYDTKADRDGYTGNSECITYKACDENGKFVLSIPEFTQEDLKVDGEYKNERTFYYRVVEENPTYGTNHADGEVETGGVKYDTKEYNLNVTISAVDDSTELGVTVVEAIDANTERPLTKSANSNGYTFGRIDYTNIVRKVTQVSGEKFWIDSLPKDAKRPDITVRLLANGVEFSKTTIEWPETRYAFLNLSAVDRYGQDIVYTVVEDPVPGYESERNGYDFYNTRGDIMIRKIDADTGDTLAGAELGIYTKDGALIESWISGVSAHVIEASLTPGAEYILREISAPTGYSIAEDIGFTAPTRGSEITITMSDKKIVGIGRLTKRDADTREVLAGAEFALYRADGTRVYATGSAGSYKYTDLTSNGVFEVNSSGVLEVTDLPYGTYYFREISAPAGYTLSVEEYPFSIISPDVTVDVTVLNSKVRGAVRLSKANSDGSRALAGAVFELYARTPASASAAIASTIYRDVYYRVGRYTTDEFGNLYVGDLPWDDYYFIEVEAPRGYEINRDINGDPIVYTFTVDSTMTREIAIDLGTITNMPAPPETPGTPPAVDSGRRLGGVLAGVLGVRAAPDSGVLGERVGPVTGDAANMLLWLLLLVACLGTIVAMLVKSKNRLRKLSRR